MPHSVVVTATMCPDKLACVLLQLPECIVSIIIDVEWRVTGLFACVFCDPLN